MDFSKLMGIASAHAEARIVQTAVELGIFDCLAERSLSATEVAARCALDHRATELLMNALVGLRLLRKRGESYTLATVAGDFLLSTAPRSASAMIRFEAALWNDWGRLADAVRLGKPSRAADMYQNNPEETERFIAAMDSLVKARGDAEVVGEILDLHNVTDLLDVGSGPATYPIAFCRRWPMLRATVFDFPGTLALTRRYIHDARLADRIALVPGDYRTDEIPGCYQMIFLSNIIHGEGPEENRSLTKKLAGVLEPGGRIIIKDHILEDSRTNPPVGAVFSLLMLLSTETGRCYAFREVAEWLKLAGLKKITHLDLPHPLTSSLITAEK